MPEIFVSYSRRNKEFTENFIKELRERDYSDEDLWVDWKDIPPSSKWEDEIRKGIENSNAIVFILSPDWVISNECAKELQIAVEYKKRLFPIIHQNIDPNKTPADLASLNWIFFRESDNFDGAMQKLLDAINTDLDWVKFHTVLLRRANEWQTREKDHSFLLRGSELQDAELWLSKSSDEISPQPTPAQNEYIFASRQDATKRQRNTLIGVSLALVVSIFLAITAVLAGIQAMRESQQALASRLAAQSITYLDTQPALSLLLSLEGNYINDTLGENDPSVFGSLVSSMNSISSLEAYLRGHDGDVRAAAFSANGQWLATAGNASNDEGYVLLWDMNAANPKPFQKFIGGTQRFLGVDFNATGSRFAAAGDEKTIFIFDTGHCCSPVNQWQVDDKVRALKYVQIGGREYIGVAAGQEITFWEVSSGKKNNRYTLQIPTEDEQVRILSLAYSPTENLIAAGGDDGNITVWNLKTSEMKYHVCSFNSPADNDEFTCTASGEGYTDIRGISFNTNGSLLASGSSDKHVWLWDAKTGELLVRSPEPTEGGHINTVSNVIFDPKTGRITSVSWDNTVKIWKAVKEKNEWNLSLVDTFAGHSSSIWAAAYSPDGKWLATSSSDKTVILWNMAQISQVGTTLDIMNGDVWALAVSPDKKLFSAADTAGNIRTWDFDGSTLSNPRTIKHGGGVLSLAYSHDGKWLASSGYTDNAIRVWDAKTGEEVWFIENAHDDQIWSIAFSPDDHWIASASFDQTVKIWDVATKTLVSNPLQHGKEVYNLVFENSGKNLLVAGFSPDIFHWDLTDITAIPSPTAMKGHAAAVNLLEINPKYQNIFASTSDDKTLLIWNTDNEEHTQPILGINESMEAVTFRPSGDWLATATNNNTVLLWQFDAKRCSEDWNADTCQPQWLGAPLNGSGTAVENVIFLSDAILVSSSEGGQIILWNLDKSLWYEQACNVVNRTLTPSEYGQYIEGKINKKLLKALSWMSDRSKDSPEWVVPSCTLSK